MEEPVILETIDPVLLGTRLQAARKAAKLSIIEARSKLIRALGDRFPDGLTLYQLEAGEQRPAPHVLIALSGIYSCSLHDLFHEQPESIEEVKKHD